MCGITARLVAAGDPQLSSLVVKINYHHVMIELEKYINDVKRVSLWFFLVIAPYEIYTIPINKHIDEK